MTEKKIIAEDGACPFSVSDNLNVEVSSYELNFNGIIVRYGSTSGWKGEKLNVPFHTFLMNVGDNDVNWRLLKDGGYDELIMKTNHIFFNPANSFINRSTKDYYEFIIVFIEPEKMNSLAQIIQKDTEYKEILNINDPNLEYIFKLLLSEVKTENQNGKLFVENITSLLAHHFIKNYTMSNSNLISNIEGFTQNEYEKTLFYIEENLSENIKLDQLAKEIGIDKFNLIKKFKSSIDVTPYQFIIQKKLERSKILLKESKYTLTDVTYMLNFSSQSHFSNSFKSAFGITPNEFRKTIDVYK